METEKRQKLVNSFVDVIIATLMSLYSYIVERVGESYPTVIGLGRDS